MRLSPPVTAAALLLWALPAPAAKLDKAICDDLKVEQGLLQQKGVAADLAKGPEWGRTLGRDRLKEIERLIAVEEQLTFRCPQPKKPLAPGEDEDGNITAAPAKGAKPATKAAALPKVAKPRPKPENADGSAAAITPVKKAAKPAPAAAATASEDAPKKVAAPKPKPKPKVDDAYSPPPSQAASSPFKN